MLTQRLGPLAVATALLAPRPAFAEPDPLPKPTTSGRAEVPDARLYFNAGARAYAAGKYSAAIRAFEEAYRIEPRPGLVFSIAQAYRRQYFIDKVKENLVQAIGHYRKYLELDPDGARRGDTAEALSELEPLSSKLSPSDTPAAPAQPPRPQTQLMISSPLEYVTIVLDGEHAGTLPYISAVTPGVHRVTLSASGYIDYQRDIRVLDGSVVPLDITLQEKPARVSVDAPEGARISVDGRPREVAPAAALALPPGKHLVTVTDNGREPFSREIVVSRDETRTLQVTMPATGQRTVAWVLMGAGGTALLAGGGLMVGALVRENSAKQTTLTTQNDISVYNDAVASRNELRTAGIATAGAGLAVGAVGVFLFAFDEPRAGAPPSEESAPEPNRPLRDPHPGLDVSATPWFAPGTAGASLRGTF
jgi:hypothetical protein